MRFLFYTIYHYYVSGVAQNGNKNKHRRGEMFSWLQSATTLLNALNAAPLVLYINIDHTKCSVKTVHHIAIFIPVCPDSCNIWSDQNTASTTIPWRLISIKLKSLRLISDWACKEASHTSPPWQHKKKFYNLISPSVLKLWSTSLIMEWKIFLLNNMMSQ